MHAHLSSFAGTALLFAAMLTSVRAQNASTLPPNVPPPGVNAGAPPRGVSAVLPPPAGFDVLRASPAAKEQYAIPPMPDAQLAPKAYEKWLKAVAGPQKHVTPVLTQTNISNGPARRVGPSAPYADASETPSRPIQSD